MNERLASTAEIIAQARLAGRPLANLEAWQRPRDEREAYRVQAMVHDLLAGTAGAHVGYKIGCTTKVMRDYLGIPNPCHGGVFARGVHASGIVLDPASYTRIGIECEIAVRIGPAIETPSDGAAMGMEAIEAVHAAVEIVDDRYVDWRSAGAPTLIADDFFAAGAVLGPARPIGEVADLGEISGVTRINGIQAGQGRGRDVMGHPANAVSWLADTLASHGGVLRPGDLVLTGSLVETRWLEAGDAAEIEIEGLGKVSLSVARR